MRQILLICLSLGLASCASTEPYMLPESDSASRAPGAAFTADSMNFSKEMPDRRDQRAWEFYYKHCSLNGNESHFSKTSYSCLSPY